MTGVLIILGYLAVGVVIVSLAYRFSKWVREDVATVVGPRNYLGTAVVLWPAVVFAALFVGGMHAAGVLVARLASARDLPDEGDHD